jgi:isopentenyl-diphosphate delta-isomerase
LDEVELIHEALPDTNLGEINLSSSGVFPGKSFKPLFVSSMTAGHSGSLKINQVLAEVCQQRGWFLGVGSQRRQLSEREAGREWIQLREVAPQLPMVANIGVTQLCVSEVEEIQELVDSIEAMALFVHTNPLQEALQREGTPNFKGAVRAIEGLCQRLSVPVILKEVGCGFSPETLMRLQGLGLFAVDLAGKGGSHWGRIEGLRDADEGILRRASESFKDWGHSSVESLVWARGKELDYHLWASGGVKNGLDVAKYLALGARAVGFARSALERCVEGPESLSRWMELVEFELKVATFCTGSKCVDDLGKRSPWRVKG